MQEQPLFQKLSSRYYKHQVPLLALDYYDSESRGEDDFSRKQVWFSVYGDEDIKEEFEERFRDLFKNWFVDDEIDWDLVTLYPTHVKDEVNVHLRELFMDVATENSLELQQILRRNHTVKESHELDDIKSKVVNLEGSIDVDRDVEGKNIILVDNIALSGISALHGANRLKQNGAENVFVVTIGIGKQNDATAPDGNLTASRLPG